MTLDKSSIQQRENIIRCVQETRKRPLGNFVWTCLQILLYQSLFSAATIALIGVSFLFLGTTISVMVVQSKCRGHTIVANFNYQYLRLVATKYQNKRAALTNLKQHS